MQPLMRWSLVLPIFLWCVLFPTSAFSQVDLSPSFLYKPPGDPSCFTISVAGAWYGYVDLEVYYPSGGPNYWYGIPLDYYGQFSGCVNSDWEEGDYLITAYYFDQWGFWDSTNTSFSISPAPPPPPVITAAGAGCDHWDCVWASGVRFYPDSRVEVYSNDWAHSEMHYGPAWQMSPLLEVNGAGDWLAFQLVDPNIRSQFGWNGVHFRVLNTDGTASAWKWVGVAPPLITSGGPTCVDLYCIQLNGIFPLNAVVDFRIPGGSEILPDAYTDLVVTETQITLRLNPGARFAYDTTGLYAWAGNPGIVNWSSAYYLGPVDRSVIGYIDDVYPVGQQYYIRGWACAKTQPTSINVAVYAGSTHVFSGTANLDSEPAVQQACQTTFSLYRYTLAIPHTVTQNYGGQLFYVYGISPVGLANNALTNSGNFLVPGVDRSIIGWVSGISTQGQNFFLYGWACAKTYPGSVDVQVYVGGPSGTGVYAFDGTANQSSEPAVAQACDSTGSNYRYNLQIPQSVIQQYAGQRIYVHGISPYGLPNLTINGSGMFTVPGGAPNSLKEFIYLGGRVIAVETTTP